MMCPIYKQEALVEMCDMCAKVECDLNTNKKHKEARELIEKRRELDLQNRVEHAISGK